MKRTEKSGAVAKAARVADECVAVRLRIIDRVVTKIYNKALTPYGVKVSQYNILAAVSAMGPSTHSDVCKILCLDKSTLSRDVDRMRIKGWLDATPGEDERTSMLILKPAGKRLLEKALPAWREAQREAVELIGERQIQAFGRIVETLREDQNGD